MRLIVRAMRAADVYCFLIFCRRPLRAVEDGMFDRPRSNIPSSTGRKLENRTAVFKRVNHVAGCDPRADQNLSLLF
jgi:hypothetical protein